MSTRIRQLYQLVYRRRALHAWTLATIACLAPLAIQAAPATNRTPERVSARVTLADLDLSTTEGMQAARARLKVAAQRLCYKVVDSRRASATTLHQECSSEALAEALRRLDGMVSVAKS
jgi:UrcA family protein